MWLRKNESLAAQYGTSMGIQGRWFGYNITTLLTKTCFFSFNREHRSDKGSESKFLDILEASKKLYFSSSEGGNLIVS